MRSPRLALALCGGLVMIFALDGHGHAQGDPGVRTPAASKGAKRSDAPSRLRTPQERAAARGQRSHLPFTTPSIGSADAPSFLAGRHRSSYAIVPFAPNPLVSSPYKATPEYEYLYTPALVSRSPPPLRSYSYRADNSYLLGSSSAYQATAWAYQWRRAPARQAAIRPSRGDSILDEPAASRNPGQKVDNGLRGRTMLPRDEKGLWRPSAVIGDLQLEDALRSHPERR
jgi:hypothetical protein